MKIEIAENLIYSYLKHVEGCRIVQTNWKTSNQWKITEYEEILSRDLFEKINNSTLFHGVFKNNAYDQLIKQAEIDVLGINTTEKSIFGIDVAFHASGLNYGSNDETAFRILKKIFRTVFIMQTYFSDFDKFNSYFVTPKVNPSTEKPIRNLIEEANKVIGDDMITVDFIANESFYSSIVDPTIKNINDENDTSELFLRSIKLIQLGKRAQFTDNNRIEKVYTKPVTTTNKREIDGMKIGQFVQYNMRKLYDQNLVSTSEILNLQDKFYSKNVFDQTYEILRSSDKEITGYDGRNRYYSKEKFFGDYYLTSQWVERHWEPFLSWLSKISKNNTP
jgi:hypothetical protein